MSYVKNQDSYAFEKRNQIKKKNNKINKFK